jgi:hypothetical protein
MNNNNTYFQYTTSAGHYSNASFKLNMYNANYDGDKDELVSPIFDMSGVDPSTRTLSFDYSFATFDANHMSDSIATISVYLRQTVAIHGIVSTTTSEDLICTMQVPSLQDIYVPGQQDEYWQNISIALPPAYS